MYVRLNGLSNEDLLQLTGRFLMILPWGEGAVTKFGELVLVIILCNDNFRSTVFRM